MIDKVALLQQVFATLRVAREPGAAKAADPRPHAGGRGAAEAPPARGAPGALPASLSDQMRRRLLAVDRQAPDARRRLTRAALETCLAAEWGSSVVDDPAFHSLVDRVLHLVDGEPSLQSVVDDALASLVPPPQA